MVLAPKRPVDGFDCPNKPFVVDGCICVLFPRFPNTDEVGCWFWVELAKLPKTDDVGCWFCV